MMPDLMPTRSAMMTGDLNLRFCRADEDPATASEYAEMTNAAMDVPAEAEGLFRVDAAALASNGAVIATIHGPGGEIAAGLHMVRHGDASEGMIRLQGVRSAPEWRGKGCTSRLIRAALSWAALTLGSSHFDLFVRCDAFGSPNAQARGAYMACGFVDEGPPTPCRVSGLLLDAHLGPVGMVFLVQRMVAGPGSLVLSPGSTERSAT